MVSLNEFELLGRLGAVAPRMVGNDCVVGVLLAVVVGEGREKLGHCLDLWEVLEDFSVFEEVVEQDEQLPQVDAFLVLISLVHRLMRQLVDQLLQLQLMLLDERIELSRGDLVGALRVALRNPLLLQDNLLSQGRANLQQYPRILALGNVRLHNPKGTIKNFMPFKRSSFPIIS